MYKIKVELRESEIINVITYLEIKRQETEKKMLENLQALKNENNPKWKDLMLEIHEDFSKENNELVELINIFKFAK